MYLSEWFTVLCVEDHKEYFCTSKNLETEDGLEIDELAVKRNDVVLWYFRGTAYEARVLEVHGMHNMYMFNHYLPCMYILAVHKLYIVCQVHTGLKLYTSYCICYIIHKIQARSFYRYIYLYIY